MAEILVVDDEADIRELLTNILQLRGHVVYAAANGAAGLRLAAEKQPDLVVLDIFMPGLGGIETLRRLRADNPAIRVLAISGGPQLSGPDPFITAQEIGVDGVLEKPFQVKELEDAIQACLGAGTR